MGAEPLLAEPLARASARPMAFRHDLAGLGQEPAAELIASIKTKPDMKALWASGALAAEFVLHADQSGRSWNEQHMLVYQNGPGGPRLLVVYDKTATHRGTKRLPHKVLPLAGVRVGRTAVPHAKVGVGRESHSDAA